MRTERDFHKQQREKENTVKWWGNMLLNLTAGASLLNEHFDPFGFKLKVWAEQMNENVQDLNEVLAELYEEYKDKLTGRIRPEFKLIYLLSTSAVKTTCNKFI